MAYAIERGGRLAAGLAVSCRLVLALFLLPAAAGSAAGYAQNKNAAYENLYQSLGDVKKVAALLNSGVDPKYAPADRQPVIFHAIGMGPPTRAVLKLLLEKGVNPNTLDQIGRNALMERLDVSSPGVVFVQLDEIDLLLAHGLDINYRSPNGETALSLTMAEGRHHLTQYLLAKGANESDQGGHAFRPLHYLAHAGNAAQVSALLKAGANPLVQDSEGRTPLIFATMGGNLDTIQALCEAGAPIDSKNLFGQTPLLIALDKSNADAAQYLLSRGASVKQADEYGHTPLVLALRMNGMPYGKNQATFDETRAVAKKVDGIIQTILDRGADVNPPVKREFPIESPLVGAIQRERLHTAGEGKSWVKVLLDRGAKLSYNGQQIPILWNTVGSDRPNLDLPRLLIDHGADVNATLDGQYLIFQAFEYQDFALVGLLIERGARVDVKDPAKKTPLHWATVNGKLDLTKAIIARGADVNAVDALGQTALMLARKQRQIDLVALLQSRGAKGHAQPAARSNPRGEPVTYLPLTFLRRPASRDGLTFKPEEAHPNDSPRAPLLHVLLNGKEVARPISFAPLLKDRNLWSHQELNDITYQLGRHFYAENAYAFFGAVKAGGSDYVGIVWYSPAASAMDQSFQYVFRIRPADNRLAVSGISKKPATGAAVSGDYSLLSLKASKAGELVLEDWNGKFVYNRASGWKTIGPPPPRLHRDPH